MEFSASTATEHVSLKFQETLEKHFADARQLISIDEPTAHRRRGATQVARSSAG